MMSKIQEPQQQIINSIYELGYPNCGVEIELNLPIRMLQQLVTKFKSVTRTIHPLVIYARFGYTNIQVLLDPMTDWNVLNVARPGSPWCFIVVNTFPATGYTCIIDGIAFLLCKPLIFRGGLV